MTASAAAPAVLLSGLAYAWPGRETFALEVDAFRLERGERLLVLGRSGGGKSTLLGLLAGVLKPARGTIELLGTDIARLSGTRRDRFRAEHCGIVFQMFNLLPYASALDNALLPLAFAPERRRRVRADGAERETALAILAALGLDGPLATDTAAAELSVGQQQRVAAARALLGRPEIVIADEPTSALDQGAEEAFLDLLFDQLARSGASLVMVSHDVALAPRFDRVLRLEEFCRTRRGSAP